jgi:hypothetical protein
MARKFKAVSYPASGAASFSFRGGTQHVCGRFSRTLGGSCREENALAEQLETAMAEHLTAPSTCSAMHA